MTTTTTTTDKRLFGRKQIAAFLQARFGCGSPWFVSAMKRAGFKLEYGQATTEGAVERFILGHPEFRARHSFCKHPQTSANGRKHLQTSANT